MNFYAWWEEQRNKIPTNRGLVSEDVASQARNAALEEAARLVNQARGESLELRQIRDAIRNLRYAPKRS